MEYKNYSDWKGWVSKNPFGYLSNQDETRFKLQLEKININYKKIKVLELGFGNGSFMNFIQKHKSLVHGIEIQENLLTEAKVKGFTVYNSIKNIKEKEYDLIAGFDVLEHMTIDQLQEFFKKSSKIIKKDGFMIFRFPNAESFAGLGAQNGDFTHITAIAKTKLDQIIQPHGLEIVKFEGELIYPNKILISFIRRIFRYLLMKGMGIGSKHFFSTNVIAVLKSNN